MVKWIKKKLNNIRYRHAVNRIMSEAMEYSIEPNVVEFWLSNCEKYYSIN